MSDKQRRRKKKKCDQKQFVRVAERFYYKLVGSDWIHEVNTKTDGI